MIYYHGTPIGGARADVVRFLTGRHALIPFFRPEDMAAAAEVCRDFVFDNSAFSIWKRGGTMDFDGYVAWVKKWRQHPGFRWALIPDVIDGTEEANDAYISQWIKEGLTYFGVPIWHLHESLERLQRLTAWPYIALGSSGEYSVPGMRKWWDRMEDVMDILCDAQGNPITKIHGLRMAHPDIVSRIPFSSVDSTNASVNAGSVGRFGTYIPPTRAQRADVIASRMESVNSPPVWIRSEVKCLEVTA